MATNAKTIHGPARRIVESVTLLNYKGEAYAGVTLDCGHSIAKFQADRTRTRSGRARCWQCRNGDSK